MATLANAVYVDDASGGYVVDMRVGLPALVNIAARDDEGNAHVVEVVDIAGMAKQDGLYEAHANYRVGILERTLWLVSVGSNGVPYNHTPARGDIGLTRLATTSADGVFALTIGSDIVANPTLPNQTKLVPCVMVMLGVIYPLGDGQIVPVQVLGRFGV